MRKKLIIFQNKQLFNILKEIKQIFEFDLDAAENEIELKNVRENNFSDYLILSKKNPTNLRNQVELNNLPMKIHDFNQFVNVKFLKSKFTEQSKINLGRYILDLNSRSLYLNEIKLELTEKESSILVFLKQLQKPAKINQLQEKVWGYNSELETHTVETHIYRLRKKIGDKFSDDDFIISDKKGYFLNDKKKII